MPESVVCLFDETFKVYDFEASQTRQALLLDMNKTKPFAQLDNPKCVIDIGANIGMWSFWVAKRYPTCRVYAVEPHRLNIMHLEMGLAANNLPNVTVIPCALASQPKLSLLWMSMANSGATGAFNNYYPHMMPSLVPAIPLNTLLESIPEDEIDHMKVDIEGGEFFLFEGFKYWNRIKSMRVEIHCFPAFRDKETAIGKLEDLSRLVLDNMGDKPVELVGGINADQYGD